MKSWAYYCSLDFWTLLSFFLHSSLSLSHWSSLCSCSLKTEFCSLQTQERLFLCIVYKTCCERFWLCLSDSSGGCLCEGLIHGCGNMMWWVDAYGAVHFNPFLSEVHSNHVVLLRALLFCPGEHVVCVAASGILCRLGLSGFYLSFHNTVHRLTGNAPCPTLEDHQNGPSTHPLICKCPFSAVGTLMRPFC